MQIFDCEQGSDERFECRLGIPTASMFHTMMAGGQGKTRTDYLYKKAGEIITGELAEGFQGNVHTERGNELEPQARELYELQSGNQVEQCGFIRADYGAGYSPDGLVDGGLIEIKTKLPHLQIKVLLDDKVPTAHSKQIQGGLEIADKEWLDFISFWPGLPLFIKRVYRDEKLIKEIRQEIDRFNNDVQEIINKIEQM